DRAESISLSILLIAAFLWITEWVPLFITSLIILGLQLVWLYPELQAISASIPKQAFLSPFFSDIILLFLGGFVLASSLHKYGIDNLVARMILKRTGKNPAVVLMGIMGISAFLSMWMSNTATTAMMLAIILPLIQRLPQGNPFGKALLLGVPFACNLGGLGTPIGTPPNAIAINYLAQKGVHISFGNWMLATIPFMLVLLALLWFLLLRLFPAGKIEIELPEDKKEKLKLSHHLVIGIFLLTVIGWLSGDLHGLSIGTVSLFPLVFIFGLGLLKPLDFKMLSWDVLFMVGGGICLGVGLQASGLTSEIVRLLPQHVTFTWILVATIVIASIMTTLMSNTATANLLIPIAVSMDQSVALLVIAIALSCSTAMALPVSTPPNAIAFGSGMLKSKDMANAGLLITLIAIALILSAGVLYWNLIGIR
ncbi:MAG: SLC13 family permease, partial [Deltaproteobacteria bacterium]|nr:SLC13 family permease [Deltaproteobacteria bacterium]